MIQRSPQVLMDCIDNQSMLAAGYWATRVCTPAPTVLPEHRIRHILSLVAASIVSHEPLKEGHSLGLGDDVWLLLQRLQNLRALDFALGQI